MGRRFTGIPDEPPLVSEKVGGLVVLFAILAMFVGAGIANRMGDQAHAQAPTAVQQVR